MTPSNERLRELFFAGGPFVSLYLDSDPGRENAGLATHRRWETVRDELHAQGVEESLLAPIDGAVPEAHRQGPCLAAIVPSNGRPLVGHGPVPPARDIARFDSLPSVGPLLEWRQAERPYVLVRTDRRGADITVSAPTGWPAHEQVESADEEPLRKVAPGGWSQRRYQQRAENTWERHARAVAEAVTRDADEVRAEIVAVAGDVRAVQLLEEHLPSRVTAILHHLPGGRADEASEAQTEWELHRQVASAAARDTVAALERFDAARGSAHLAADGPDETFAALQRSKVDVLLAHEDLIDRRVAWFGAYPTAVALDRSDLTSIGVRQPAEARLVAVALRAALGTGAEVHVIPAQAGPRDGIGALLRWS